MKKTDCISIIIISLALIFILGSCAKPPTAEVEEAKAAVAGAESNSDVQMYAADALAKAKDSLTRMKKELDAKKYDSARTLALEATKNAGEAVSSAKTAKERIKTSTSAVLGSLKNALIETEKALTEAKKIRGIKLDFTSSDAEIDAVRKALASAEIDFNAASYKTAAEKGESAQSRLSSLTKSISDAVRSASKKK